jgi:hypothetical protein
MSDPLQYLRDLQVVAIPTPPQIPQPGRPIRAARAGSAPGSGGAGALDPRDLPALALRILAEGKAPSPPAPRATERRLLRRCNLPGGERCSLPIRYFDARCLIAAFSIERARADAALETVGLRSAGDAETATALFGCFEYRDTDLGPYNEVGLSIPAVAPGDSRPALYVLHLPVNTAATDRVGRALWGYPKFVAGIDISGDARAFSTTLRDSDGLAIATFEGALAAARPSPPVDLSTFTVLDGQLLRTRIDALSALAESDGAAFSLRLGPSSHPMTESLRALGLDGARPARVSYADPFQALLFPGFPV